LGEPGGSVVATVDTSFCLAALGDALARFARLEIFNTDQGSQFTSAGFTGALAAAGIKISMDGQGRWMGNVFIEHVWRFLKHEDVYLKGYADGHEAKTGIASWWNFTTISAFIRRSATGRRWPSGAKEWRRRRLWT
jgi:putative transposase